MTSQSFPASFVVIVFVYDFLKERYPVFSRFSIYLAKNIFVFHKFRYVYITEHSTNYSAFLIPSLGSLCFNF